MTSNADMDQKMREQILAAMPHVPLNVAELSSSRAFLSADADIVRAAVLMRCIGFTRFGVMPARFDLLAPLLGLEQSRLESHFSDICDGWSLAESGELHHEGLREAAQQMFDRYAAQVKEWHTASMAYAASAGLEFEALKASAKKSRVSRAMTKAMTFEDFENKVSIDNAFINAGINEEADQEWVLEQFNNYHLSNASVKRSDWDATLRTWIGRVRPHELPSRRNAGAVGRSSVQVSSLFGGSGGRQGGRPSYGTSGDAIAANNRNLFSFGEDGGAR